MFNKRPPRGHFHRKYCGKGSKRSCRIALRLALRQALNTPKEKVYTDETCAKEKRVEAACSDETRSTSASGVGISPFQYINRPTFQQTIELTRKLAR